MISTIYFQWLLLTATAAAQMTYTGCHNHSSIEFCFGPDGEETAVATFALQTLSSAATLPATVSASATTAQQSTAVTACHTHETEIFCINGAGQEVSISLSATVTGPAPAEYTDCHAHGSEQYCVDPEGDEVLVALAHEEGEHEDESEHGHHHEDEDEHSSAEEEMDCHFHAGVEHCVPAAGSSESSSTASVSCERVDRDYDIGLRVGTLFVVLVTSAIGVFAPILLAKLPSQRISSWAVMVVKQFGTGVIVSTAFVHLYTHSSLMFTNPCLGRLDYESTTSAIVMAGLFLAFLVEYMGHRVALALQEKRRKNKDRLSGDAGSSSPSSSSSPKSESEIEERAHPSTATPTGPADPQTTTIANLSHSHTPFSSDPTNPNTPLSVSILEFGILFHSLLLGLTLTLVPDSLYRTLLAVLIFHQFFEGLALGSRLSLMNPVSSKIFPTKFLMALAFALVTPIGMAIGVGVSRTFNGNDPATIAVIGSMDAVSAGVLVWVGVVDMWANDWVRSGGEMVGADVGWAKVAVGLASLVAGFVGMSVLGKWA